MTMRWKGLRWAVAAALLPVAGARADEGGAEPVGSVTVDAASAYVFRGGTLNDGAVVQPSIEASVLPGLTIGVWANLDLSDNDGALPKREFSEVDLTASYALEFESVTLSLGYAEYLYPGAEVEGDREVSLSLELPLPASPKITANYGFDGAVKKNLYLEAEIGHEVELAEDLTFSIGATLGYAVPDEGDSGLSHFTVSASLGLMKYFTVSATYIGQLDDDVLTDEQYVREFVAAISFSLPF